MLEQVRLHQTEQQEKRGEFTPSKLHTISDKEMVDLIACPGLTQRFDLSQIAKDGGYINKKNEQTNADFLVREEALYDRQGQSYQLEIQRDLDAVAIAIYSVNASTQQKTPIIKVGLRDREFDGSPQATPFGYLQAFDGKKTHEIPARSKQLGTVDWHYSSESDQVAHGMRAVELSVISSDPTLNVKEPLTAKQRRHEGKLWVDADQLATFIDDPFAKLPEGTPPDTTAMNDWYRNWWQVTNRILRGKAVPLPGQTSQRAFNGFLEHATTQSAKKLKALGYNKLSAVPTWEYVREKFQKLGFTPDDQTHHNAAEDFLASLSTIKLRHLSRRDEQFHVCDFVNQKALISWLAVLPFAIQRDPTHTPHLSLAPEYERGFHEIFAAVRQAVTVGEDIRTYPLAPKQNLWYSLSLT